jgi:hypothetical protein
MVLFGSSFLSESEANPRTAKGAAKRRLAMRVSLLQKKIEML